MEFPRAPTLGNNGEKKKKKKKQKKKIKKILGRVWCFGLRGGKKRVEQVFPPRSPSPITFRVFKGLFGGFFGFLGGARSCRGGRVRPAAWIGGTGHIKILISD